MTRSCPTRLSSDLRGRRPRRGCRPRGRSLARCPGQRVPGRSGRPGRTVIRPAADGTGNRGGAPMPVDNAEDVAPARPPDRELLGLAQTLGAVLAGVGNNFCFRLLAALPVSELVVRRALAGAAWLEPPLVLAPIGRAPSRGRVGQY